MTFQLKKISDFEIKKVRKIGEIDDRPWKSESLFSNGICNVFALARKNSGKSSVIYNIVKESAGKSTKIIVFSATHSKDDTTLALKDWLAKKGIVHICYDSIEEDGVNLVELLIDEMKRERVDEDSESEDEEAKTEWWEDEMGAPKEKKKAKPKQAKYRVPEYIIIFDDISTQLRDRWVTALCKTNRHYRAMVLISSQFITDVTPGLWRQIDYLLIFKGISADRVTTIHNNIGLDIPINTFIQAYNFATENLYSLLYIDVQKQKLRKNFNQEIVIGNVSE